MHKYLFRIIALAIIFSPLNLPVFGSNHLVEMFQEGVRLSNQGEYQKALNVYSEVIAADPSYAAAHLGIGIAYINLKKPENALPYVRRATELNPRNRKAFFILARLYERADQKANAIKTWEHFLSLGPEAKYGRIAKRHLGKLSEDAR
ncbi:MAG: tetratricopeptide repeat protein [Elusimicrobia bacterium]|nr:tetratricopeptide repeat protein [Elusimicrobiota bacterium]